MSDDNLTCDWVRVEGDKSWFCGEPAERVEQPGRPPDDRCPEHIETARMVRDRLLGRRPMAPGFSAPVGVGSQREK